MQPRLLVVDDEKDARSAVERYFKPRGFRVLTAASGSAALAILGEAVPDLVVTDADMPDMDGFALCRIMRKDARLKGVPVIMISGKVIDERGMVRGFEDGADDYVLKPVSLPLLLARVQAVLRRRRSPGGDRPLKGAEVALDLARREAKVGEKTIALTRKEFDLLALLISSDGRVLSAQQLLEAVWGYDLAIYNDPRTVQVHVSRLRKKLGPKAGKRIVQIVGAGYRFDA